MEDERQAQTYEAILQAVEDLLELGGYDAVQVRAVAKRARVSLTTLYKFFPTLDALIVAALARWMESNGYSGLANAPPAGASFQEGLMWIYRQIFEPYERNPRMLHAYHRAMSGPCGEQLDKGMAVVEPVARVLLDKVDPAYAEDVGQTMHSMICGVIQRFAKGEFPVTDILPMIERTLFRLTSDNATLATGTRRRKRSTRARRPTKKTR
jgi:AcrR family transcriptional regulator